MIENYKLRSILGRKVVIKKGSKKSVFLMHIVDLMIPSNIFTDFEFLQSKTYFQPHENGWIFKGMRKFLSESEAVEYYGGEIEINLSPDNKILSILF